MRLFKKQTEKKIVLLVDDSVKMNHLVSGILSKDYNVYAFGSAADAIEWLTGQDIVPDVVLCDTALNEITGIELGYYLTLNGLFDQIPLVYMSSDSEQDLSSALENVNYQGYTQKPFNPENLLKTIHGVVTH